jgi:hypothetical protein
MLGSDEQPGRRDATGGDETAAPRQGRALPAQGARGHDGARGFASAPGPQERCWEKRAPREPGDEQGGGRPRVARRIRLWTLTPWRRARWSC